MEMRRSHCLFAADLLPWERHYFTLFTRSLSTAVPALVVGDSLPGDLNENETIWLVARNWYAALKAVPPKHKGQVFVSALSTRPRDKWLALFPRNWNPHLHLKVTLVVHSPFAYRFYREMEGIPASQLFYIPLPAFLDEPKALDSSAMVRVGFHAPLLPEGNLGFIASVAHYVSRFSLPIRFSLFGGGRLKEHMLAVTADLGLASMVEFAQFNSDAFPVDVLVYAPLRADHFIPILLAASKGIPVLATDVPGLENMIADGHDGFVVPVNESKPLGELIVRYAQNASLRHSLGDRLRQGLAKRLALDRLLDRYAQLLSRQPVSRMEAAAA